MWLSRVALQQDKLQKSLVNKLSVVGSLQRNQASSALPQEEAKQSVKLSLQARPDPTLLALAFVPRAIPQLGSRLWFPVSRDLCPSVPVCPLDNAHLCESLYSTPQE